MVLVVANAGNLLNSVFDYDTGKQVTENFGKYGIWAGYVVSLTLMTSSTLSLSSTK